MEPAGAGPGEGSVAEPDVRAVSTNGSDTQSDPTAVADHPPTWPGIAAPAAAPGAPTGESAATPKAASAKVGPGVSGRPKPGPKPAAKPGAFKPGVKPGAKPAPAKAGGAKPGGAKPGATGTTGGAKGGGKPPVRQVAGKRPPAKPGAKKSPAKQGTRVSGGLIALASATFIIVVVGIIVAIKLTSSPAAKQSGLGILPGSPQVVTAATNVPVSVLNQEGLGTPNTVLRPQKVAGSPPLLTSGAKPELFFLGGNYCPYCATERWPMVVALSRFGTFKNLGETTSSSTDVYPNTQTFSFYGSTYTSKYLSFVPVEVATNKPDGAGGYTTLQTPSKAQLKLTAEYDAPPYVASSQSAGGIPFQDYGNRFLVEGPQYGPQALQGQTADLIAGSLSVPSSPIAQGIDGAANWDTAAICELTNNAPSSVCSLPVIKTAESDLSKLKAP